jgi:hypothetical protein
MDHKTLSKFDVTGFLQHSGNLVKEIFRQEIFAEELLRVLKVLTNMAWWARTRS